MYCIRHILNSGIFSTLFFRYMHVHGIFNHLKSYWDMFTHKAYSGLFRHIQLPVSPLHIHNLVTFWALTYLEPQAYLNTCETLTRHIQNPALGYYSVIFMHIQSLVQRLHKQKPGIFGILKYPEPFHNCIPAHIENPDISTKIYKYSELLTHLKSDTYSGPCQRL